MQKISSVIKTGSLLTVMLMFMPTSDCRAFFYRPAAEVRILSEYAASNDAATARTQVWKVVPEGAPDGAALLRFFPEGAATQDPVCEIHLSPLGAAGEIVWNGTGGRGEKRSRTGLLLAPGFPAPSDVLPVGESGEGQVYEEKTEAGGSVFKKRYLVSSEAVFVTKARTEGWIKGEAPDTAELIMVTVTDDKGRMAVRQLWPAEGPWWLYEETPLRRSWLLPY